MGFYVWSNGERLRSCGWVGGQVWKPQLGAVELSLTVGAAQLELTVSPLQATLLLQFRVCPPCSCCLLLCALSRAPGSCLGVGPCSRACRWGGGMCGSRAVLHDCMQVLHQQGQ